jgi:uncharacterized protein (TIGR02145 family)
MKLNTIIKLLILVLPIFSLAQVVPVSFLQNTAPTYPAGSVFCASGATAIVDVINPSTGKTWMDRNLGATQVATSSNDANSYGDLYQGGRGSDGHQCRTSPTTTILSAVDQPGNGNFIVAPNSPFDWRSSQNNDLWQGVNGINNPCPSGYRLPTQIELNAERTLWSPSNASGAFASPLKLPVAGGRNGSDGSLAVVGSFGYYWSSTLSGSNARFLGFNSSAAWMSTNGRAIGFSVRCIKDASVALTTPIVTPTIGTYTFSGAPQGPTTASNTGTGTSYTFSYAGVSPTVYAASASLPTAAGDYTVTVTVAADGNFTSATSVATAFTIAIVTPTYPAGSVFCASGATTIVDVTNPATGKTWMDRNLGATQVATSSDDANSYGDLYQWGRGSDGHQCRTSSTTTTESAVDQPADGNFITSSTGDWRSPQNDNLWLGVNGINNPCPTGYRLPTSTELEAERNNGGAGFWGTGSVQNNAAGAFASVLKLPMAGYRDYSNGSLSNVGSFGVYWSSTIGGTNARRLGFNSSTAPMDTNYRAFGFSVRCLKDASVALTTPVVTPTIGTYTFSGAPQGPTTATNTGTGIDYTFSYAGVSPTVYPASTSLPTAAGNYTVTATVAANGNFTSASSVATEFSIALATPIVTPTIETYTFSGVPQGPNTATNIGTGTSYTFSYAGVSPTVYAASASLPTAAGDYTVTVTVAANGNFTSASSVATAFTIAISTSSYPAGSVFCASGPTTIVEVTTATGKTWMDRNLGATQVATSSDDANSYGDLYQWGRGSDGHQCRTSSTTTTLSAVDQPANGNFIRISNSPRDWRDPQNDNLWQGANGINNPCPTGYRLPTDTELNEERASWSSNDNAAGAFASPLKLPMAGGRSYSNGSLAGVGSGGGYWASTISGTNARYLYFDSSSAFMDSYGRAFGFSVRCLKE